MFYVHWTVNYIGTQCFMYILYFIFFAIRSYSSPALDLLLATTSPSQWMLVLVQPGGAVAPVLAQNWTDLLSQVTYFRDILNDIDFYTFEIKK